MNAGDCLHFHFWFARPEKGTVMPFLGLTNEVPGSEHSPWPDRDQSTGQMTKIEGKTKA